MSLLLPGIIGCGVALVLGLLLPGAVRLFFHRTETSGAWTVPLALGIAYALGHAAVREWLRAEWPPWPPSDAIDWTAWVAPIVGVLGAFEVARPNPAWSRWLHRLAIAGGLLWLILGPLAGGTWTPSESVAWLAGCGAALLVVWGVLDLHAKRLGRGVLLPVMVWIGATAACMMLCHSLRLAEFVAVLLCGLVGLGIVSIWWRGLSLARGGSAVVVTVFAALVLSARFYGYPELPLPSLVALAVAPLMLWLDRIPFVRERGPIVATLWRVLAILIPCGVAIGFALPEFLKAGLEAY